MPATRLMFSATAWLVKLAAWLQRIGGGSPGSGLLASFSERVAIRRLRVYCYHSTDRVRTHTLHVTVRRRSLKYVLMIQLLLLSPAAFGADKTASCELASTSIVSHSSSGLAQVSNLGDIQIACSVPARALTSKSNGLRAATIAYKISPDSSKELVPSEVHQYGSGGGGIGPVRQPERVLFFAHIPLESAELDAEASRYLARMQELGKKEMPPVLFTEDDRRRALENLRELVYQHRVGHFLVQCRVLDGDQVIGVGVVELEVLFKGRFSDSWLRPSPFS